ncbi:hypothetical protein GDO81_024818 [Engystomops pustulosus]|uniref:Uncharacterized protein n=1 Tax=Engystomops pustulosus TaxID=76066 RepID=A0AAV6YME6_ENGPU|nr:hypothetical protein GDO81_024818 [Engystomops pustulosus]
MRRVTDSDTREVDFYHRKITIRRIINKWDVMCAGGARLRGSVSHPLFTRGNKTFLAGEEGEDRATHKKVFTLRKKKNLFR